MDEFETSRPTADKSGSSAARGEQPTRAESWTTHPSASIPKPGDRVGPYTLLELIGEGGFGTVWLAERREPMVQRVAMKIIKPGMDSRAVVARFEQERQTLALMDHPGVASVFDGGVTDRGLPYFVMEYVPGKPITEFCDRQRSTIIQRLRLLIAVCDAVHHAHIKGIIHRDLKPSNILVQIVDHRPLVKVIDFGIAKALVSDPDRTHATSDGAMIGTPAYMSPEQADGRLDIDVRADVYSLGILLYELLVGSVPFDPAELRRLGLVEMQRVIRESVPPRPSARLMPGDAPADAAADNRGLATKALARMLRRELEWIPLKAIRKERERRYESAAALAEDIRRYLRGRPMAAGPDSTAYLVRKFVGRHRVLVGAAAAVFVALGAGLTGTIAQAREAARQRDAAEAARVEEAAQRARADERAAQLRQVTEFQSQMLSRIDTAKVGTDLIDDVRRRFAETLARSNLAEAERSRLQDGLDAGLARVNATDVAATMIDRAVLRPAAAAIDERFANQPLVDAELRQSLADLYESIGLYDAALPLQQSALETRRRLLGDDHPDTLHSLNNAALLQQSRGMLAEAETLYREALDRRRRILGDDHRLTVTSISNLGLALQARGQFAEALTLQQQALHKRRRILGDEHPETLTSINNLAGLFQAQGRLADAEPLYREALEQRTRILGPEHTETLISISNMGFLLQAAGRLAEAEPFFRDALTKQRRVLGDDHPDTLRTLSNLGVLLQNRGQPELAEPYVREALDKLQRSLGPDHPNTLRVTNNLGALLQSQGKVEAAEPHFRKSLEARRRVLGDEHPETLAAMHNLGSILLQRGLLTEAESLLRPALDISTRVLGDSHPTSLVLAVGLGRCLERQSRHREAIDLLGQIEPPARAAFRDANARRLADLLVTLGRARLALLAKTDIQAFREIADSLLEAHEILTKARGSTHADTIDCGQAIVDLYTAWHAAEPDAGHDAKALQWKTKHLRE
ncbi:MAG TPA: tetratricopeptide repeat protein [Phycisphaerales bacterium]